jgi:parallel beta-helix repeat protein
LLRLATRVVCAVLLVAAMLSVFYARAGAPTRVYAQSTSSTMNFQGRLLAANGNIVPDGYYNLQFKLYTTGTNGTGTNLWTETHYDSNGVTAGNDNRVRVVNGYFSVNLGSQTAFSGINWDQELWLTMNVGGSTQTATPTWDGEMLNGTARTKLTAVPYAFTAGQLAFSVGGNRGTLGFNSVANNPVIQLPDIAGTNNVLLQNGTTLMTQGSVPFVDASGRLTQDNASFFFDDTNNRLGVGSATPQATLHVNGTVRLQSFTSCSALETDADGDLVCGADDGSNNAFLQGGNSFGATAVLGTNDNNSLELETNGTTRLTIDTSGNVSLTGSVTVAAQQTIRLIGGTTAQRPASPTEGMLYFDTDTDQLLIYANGKWQADRSIATKIVAASTSTQAAKDSADFVADGEAVAGTNTVDGDQVQIQQAISALPAGGGTVYLLEGTYTIDAAISIPSNVTIAGSGAATIVRLTNTSSNSTSPNFNAIINSDPTNGNSNITIRDLQIDGSVATAGTHSGIRFTKVGTSAFTTGATVTGITTKQLNESGVHLVDSYNSKITNNIDDNSTHGVTLQTSEQNVVSNNIMMGPGTVTGVLLYSASNNVISNNRINSANEGVELDVNSSKNLITSNVISNSDVVGINLIGGSSENIVASNRIINPNDDGIYLSDADGNTITGNQVTDTAANGTDYAINISNATSDNNYLSDNTFSGTGAVGVQNNGTGTVYSNQARAVNGGQLTVRTANDTAAFQIQNASGTALFSADTNNFRVGIGVAAPQATLHVDGTLRFEDFISCTALETNANGDLVCGTDDGAAGAFVQGGNSFTATAVLGTNDAFDLEVETSGVTRLVIQADGDLAVDTNTLFVDATNNEVGIGTASPDSTLHVSKTGAVELRLTSDASWPLILKQTNTSVFSIANGGTERMTLDANGDFSFDLGTLYVDAVNNRVGVGDTTPAYAFTVGSGDLSGIDSTGALGVKTSGEAIGYDFALGQGADRTIGINTRTTNAAGRNLTVTAGDAGAGASAFSGGQLILQGGDAAGTGNANGGAVTIIGGAGVGTGTQGLVNLSTSAFTSSAVQTDSISAGFVDLYSTIPLTASTTGLTISVPDPAQNTIGRLLYITARNGSNDFTLRLNAARTPIDIAMKANSTATLIWNGVNWTAAGASSSTDLQSAYNNTLTSAGGAEIVLNPVGGNADGFTIRNNNTTPIIGGLLEVQSSIGTNLFSVNNYGTELAANGGAENSSTFATNWTTVSSATITRNTTSGQFVTGLAGVQAATTGSAGQGVRNNLSGNPAVSTTYQVSFAIKSSSAIAANNLIVRYSYNGGTNTTDCTNYSSQAVSTSVWTKITCIITTPANAVTDPDLIIIQNDAATRNIWIDNLSFQRNDATTNTTPSNVQVGGGINGGPVTLLTLDRSSSPPVPNGDSTYYGSMYYDTVTGRIQCYEADGWGACGSAPDNIISLTPEYSGAVLNGTGVGTMTADFCANQTSVLVVGTLCASGLSRQFYKWTSPQSNTQTYSIYVSYKLPNTFKEFISNDTITLTGLSDNVTNGQVTFQVFRSSGSAITACGTETDVVATTDTANTWYTRSINGNEMTGCSFAASDTVIFKINVKTKSNASVYVENLNFTYTNK